MSRLSSSSFLACIVFFCCIGVVSVSVSVVTVSAHVSIPSTPSSSSSSLSGGYSSIQTRVFVSCTTDCQNGPQQDGAAIFGINITQVDMVSSFQQQVIEFCDNSTFVQLALAQNPALSQGLVGAVLNPTDAITVIQPNDYLCFVTQNPFNSSHHAADAATQKKQHKRERRSVRKTHSSVSDSTVGWPRRVSVSCDYVTLLVPLYLDSTTLVQDVVNDIALRCNIQPLREALTLTMPGITGLQVLPNDGLALSLIQDNDSLTLARM